MTEKELLAAFLSKTLNMDTDGVASLYNEDGSELKTDALEILLQQDVDRVKALKPDTKKVFDDGYKKAQSEVLSKLEKDFQEKAGFKSDKKGIDLFLEYAADAAKKSGGSLTDDNVKKHPLFIQLQDQLASEVDKANKTWEEKFNQLVSEGKKKEAFASISKKAMEHFETLKPILSKDAKKAANQKGLLVKELSSYEYEIQGDKIIVLKDGKVLEDDHGKRISFEDVVKSAAENYFDFEQIQRRDNAGNGADGNGGSAPKTFKFDMPKTDDDYAKMVSDPKRPVEERMAIKEAYRKQAATV